MTDEIRELNGIKYLTPNRRCVKRVERIHIKDELGMRWLHTQSEGDILLDVGGNVGMYALPAAFKHKLRVYAFEPEHRNYSLLCRNIILNGLQDQITAYCLAVSDKMDFNELYINGIEDGTSCHSFGEELDYNLNPTKSAAKQGCMSITIDQFMENRSVEKDIHLKIDVDGFDYKVILGAEKTLQNPKTKSVIMEINTNLEKHRNVFGIMENHGFEMVESCVRSEGNFVGVGNHVFIRSHIRP